MSKPDGRVILYEGNFLRLVTVDGWEYAERTGISGIVVVVAVTDDDKVVLVEQHRRPQQARVIELPAGLAGDIPGAEHEPLARAAGRELFEETGYEAAEISHLTAGPISPGMTTEFITFWLARGLKKTGQGGGDTSEDILVHEVSLAGIEKWLDDRRQKGLLIDPKVYAGLYFVQRP